MNSPVNIYKRFKEIVESPITCIDIPYHITQIVKMKDVILDTHVTIGTLANHIYDNIVIASKILNEANTAPRGSEFTSVLEAIKYIGVKRAKQIAYDSLLVQFENVDCLLYNADLIRKLWLRTLYTAAAARCIAETCDIKPCLARMTGIALRIGANYLLFNINKYPESPCHKEDIKYLIDKHYLPITRKMARMLKLPTLVQQGIRIHEVIHSELSCPPKSLRDLIYISNIIADNAAVWIETETKYHEVLDKYVDMMEKIQRQYQEYLRLYS